MAPGLLTGKIKAPPLPNDSPTPTAYTNGHIPNGVNNNNIIKRGEDIAKTFLNSSDFKKLDTRSEDVVDISHFSSSNAKLKTTTTTNTEETLTETKTYQTKPVANGIIGSQKKSIIDEDRNRNVVKSSIADMKFKNKMEPAKDFGNFSSLSTPGLLTGKPTTTSSLTTNNNNEYEKEESKVTENTSSYRNSFLSRANNEDTAENDSSYKSSFLSRANNEDRAENNSSYKSSFLSRKNEENETKHKASEDYSSNTMFSTTISKTVKDSRSNSFNNAAVSSGAEQSFVISTDPEVKSLKPVSGSKFYEPVSSPVSNYSKVKETETRISSIESSRPRLSSPPAPTEHEKVLYGKDSTVTDRKSSITEERKSSLTGSKVFTHHTIASAAKVNAIAPPRAMSKSPVRSSRSKSPEIPSWATKDYSTITSEVTTKKASFIGGTSSATSVSSSTVKKSSSAISSRASPKRSMIPRRTSDAGGKALESQGTSSPKGSRNSKGKKLLCNRLIIE